MKNWLLYPILIGGISASNCFAASTCLSADSLDQNATVTDQLTIEPKSNISKFTITLVNEGTMYIWSEKNGAIEDVLERACQKRLEQGVLFINGIEITDSLDHIKSMPGYEIKWRFSAT